MRRLNMLVFDEVVGTQVARQDTVYTTSPMLNDLLGQFDQLGFQAIADNATASTISIEIHLETSCDGRNWVLKSTTPQIPATAVNATGVTVLPWGQDDGTLPNYVLVRLVARFTSSTPASVHLRIFLTARDQGGVIHKAFTASQYHPVLPKPKTPDLKKLYMDCMKKMHSLEYCTDRFDGWQE